MSLVLECSGSDLHEVLKNLAIKAEETYTRPFSFGKAYGEIVLLDEINKVGIRVDVRRSPPSDKHKKIIYNCKVFHSQFNS